MVTIHLSRIWGKFPIAEQICYRCEPPSCREFPANGINMMSFSSSKPMPGFQLMRHCFQTTSQAIDDEWGEPPFIGLVKLMNHLYPFSLPINIPLFGLGRRRLICGTGLVNVVFVWWVSMMFIAFSSNTWGGVWFHDQFICIGRFHPAVK